MIFFTTTTETRCLIVEDTFICGDAAAAVEGGGEREKTT